jgi:hypothetical protein
LLFDNIGFYDDYVKFTSEVSLKYLTANYEDIEIYKVLGYYDLKNQFYENENDYTIVAGDDYYNFVNVDENGETEQKLKSIVNQYNKQIIEVKTFEEINF